MHRKEENLIKNHRVDRVVSFFSNRPDWDFLTPSHTGECVPNPPPPLWFCGGGGGTLACGRGVGWPIPKPPNPFTGQKRRNRATAGGTVNVHFSLVWIKQ